MHGANIKRKVIQTRTSNWLRSIYYYSLLPFVSATGYGHPQGAKKFCSFLKIAIS